MGGKVRIIAEFPNRAPIVFAERNPPRKSTHKRANRRA